MKIGDRIVCIDSGLPSNSYGLSSNKIDLKLNEVYTIANIKTGFGHTFLMLKEVQGRYDSSRFKTIERQKEYRTILEDFEVSIQS